MTADADRRSGPIGVLKDRLGRAASAAGASTVRSRLFIKYVALFVTVVVLALVANGAFEIWFSYQEHKASLISIQREQAEAAAAKIEQFITEIESQVGWTTQLPWSDSTLEQRRFDALRLLRQVPAITELAQINASGHEQLRVSRLAMEVVGSGIDMSKEPEFTEAVAHKVYYGPVYFRRESEPYMTLSLAGTRRDTGVSIAAGQPEAHLGRGYRRSRSASMAAPMWSTPTAASSRIPTSAWCCAIPTCRTLSRCGARARRSRRSFRRGGAGSRRH